MSHLVCRKSMFYNQISSKYRPSPIPSGGLEIPLLLNFTCPEQKTFEKMKNLVDPLYDCHYSEMKKKLHLSLKLTSQSITRRMISQN